MVAIDLDLDGSPNVAVYVGVLDRVGARLVHGEDEIAGERIQSLVGEPGAKCASHWSELGHYGVDRAPERRPLAFGPAQAEHDDVVVPLVGHAELFHQAVADVLDGDVAQRHRSLLQPVQSVHDRLAPALDQAVGVHDQRCTGVEDTGGVGPGGVDLSEQRCRPPVLQPVGSAVSGDDEHRRVSGRGESQHTGRRVERGVARRGELRTVRSSGERVELRQQVSGTRRVGSERGERDAQSAHRSCCVEPVPDDVTYGEGDPPVGKLERVVPVSAYFEYVTASLVTGGDGDLLVLQDRAR